MDKIYPGYYSLLQFCADAARGEMGNVGIAVISPTQGLARVLSGKGRFARYLIQTSPLQECGFSLVIEGFVQNLLAALQDNPSPLVLEKFKPNGANPISLSKVREMTLRDIDIDAQRLLKRLVC